MLRLILSFVESHVESVMLSYVIPAVIQCRVRAGQRPLGPLGAHCLLDAGPICREVGQLVEYIPLPEIFLCI